MSFKFYSILFILLIECSFGQERSFVIDTKEGIFRKDGQPFQYVSGSFHYFRIPKIYWKDRLMKYKEAGLDAIQVYIPWNIHEPQPGLYNFNQDKDLNLFFKLVHDQDLLLLLRPGPYICAEWDFGGLPGWIWVANESIQIRSSDPSYKFYVSRWWNKLMPVIKPFLYENGGPIIMVQIENEYGSYPNADKTYMEFLVSETRKYLGEKVIFYTTDGNSMDLVKNGRIPKEIEAENNIITVDFGYTKDTFQAFEELNKLQPNKPLINSEQYFGWLSHWGEKRQMMNDDSITTLRTLFKYSKRVNVNIYMFHGGTNFGLTNGANAWAYEPSITSYDYGAPICENGDITLNYLKLRQTILEMKGIPDKPLPPTIKNVTTRQYDPVNLAWEGNWLTTIDPDFLYPEPYPFESPKINFFEQGFVVYSVTLKKQSNPIPKKLSINYVRDNLQVFTTDSNLMNLKYQAEIGPKTKTKEASIILDDNTTILHLIVENQGRINYGGAMQGDIKGIIGPITVEGQNLGHWSMTILDLTAKAQFKSASKERTMSSYMSTMKITDEPVADTFITVNVLGRGIIIINDILLGRFNTRLGPQISLYAPSNYWKLGENNIRVVFTNVYESIEDEITVKFSKDAIWK